MSIWTFVGGKESYCEVPPGGSLSARMKCCCDPDGFLCEVAEKVKAKLWHSGATSRQAVISYVQGKREAVEVLELGWCPNTKAIVMLRLEAWSDDLAAR